MILYDCPDTSPDEGDAWAALEAERVARYAVERAEGYPVCGVNGCLSTDLEPYWGGWACAGHVDVR